MGIIRETKYLHTLDYFFIVENVDTMKKTIFLFLSVIFCYGHSTDVEPRRDRAFSLFNVVKFKNTACQAASFGVCCIVSLNTCGSTVSQNCSYVENPGYPTGLATATPSCQYMVTRCSSDICQVRLDFKDFVLGQPAVATGLCTDGLVVALGAGTAAREEPPRLCGTNTGEHIYIDAGRSANNAATLTFTTTTANVGRWRVKVSQIECNNPNRAPDGCLQYYTGNVNTVRSFNFGDGTGDCSGGCLTQTQDYMVCFRTENGMCGIDYTPTARTSGDSFELGTHANVAAIAAAACLEGANDNNAAIQVSYVEPDSAVTGDLYCGDFLSAKAGDNANSALNQRGHQFRFRVIAMNGLAQNSMSGFELSASQVPC